jgi:tetratricopeptide (TPR) repeat protein
VIYLDAAIAACKQALENQSDVALTCQVLGNILQSMGKFEEATHWHTQSVTEPNLAESYAQLGNLYFLQQQWQEAVVAYEAALNLDAQNLLARWYLADVLFQTGQQTEALDYWYQVLTTEPGRTPAEGHLKLGDLFWQQGNAERALTCYEQALQQDPGCSNAYQNLAEMLQVQGNWQTAIETYHRAIQNDPNPAWAYCLLGNVLFQQGQVEQAIAIFSKGIEQNPSFYRLQHDLIELLLKQGLWDRTIALSRSTIASDPSLPWAYSQLGRALTALGRVEESVDCYRKGSAARGWQQCLENNYYFTHDWFTHNIPVWEKLLASIAHVPHINCLEIGGFEGMATCWLLDCILAHPTAKISCIDLGFPEQFDANIFRTGAAEKVTKLTGNSHEVLSMLPSDSYDMVYIDGCSLAAHIERDAELSWSLLKFGGLLIFDDYEWINPQQPDQSPKVGIDTFLAKFQGQIKVIHKSFQVIVEKLFI